MNFVTRLEAYTFTLKLLINLKNSSKNTTLINTCIKQIKIAIEDHELDAYVVVRFLEVLEKNLKDRNHRDLVKELIDSIRSSSFDNLTLLDKFQNPLRRRFESELVILMLKQPTSATMYAVGRLSQAIIAAIDENNTHPNAKQTLVLKRFLFCLLDDKSTVGLGSFKQTPSLDEVKSILKANAPDTLARIMQIHYRYARYAFRDLPVTIPTRAPCGKYAEIINKRYGSIANYAKLVKAVDAALNMDGHKTTPGYIDRAWLADEVFYNSPLYQNEPDRGRLPVTDREYTNQLGLMLITQVDDAKGLPTETSRWLAECDVRVPRMDSRTARDYLDNDALFVTGPSGMTSLFLGQMEVLANFESEALKRYYLSAVIAYVAASGFHSMHEIIGPAQYALNLVPGYPIKAPDLINHTKAPAPHYHHYFNYMSIIDPGFADLKERAWQQYLNYFNDIYLQKNGVKERLQTETVVKPVSKKRDPWFHFFRAGKKTAALPAELSLQQKIAAAR